MTERGAYPTREVLLEEVAALRRRLNRIEEVLDAHGITADLEAWLRGHAEGGGQTE